MRNCRVTITTIAGGEENSIIRKGEMQLSSRTATVCYLEEDAKICLKVEENCVDIERKGDYTLSLHLLQGKQNKGRLGIMGSDGEIGVHTHKVAYSIGEDFLLLSLHYDLLFGEDKQQMQLRMLARLEKTED